jgi:hypothetical protein
MADGDYWARNSTPKWRSVASTLRGGQDVSTVASIAREAYAETMRLGKGVPGLNELVAAFVAAATKGERERWLKVGEEVRREASHHAHTEQAVCAGQALLETDSGRLREMDTAALGRELAHATAQRIAEQHFARCTNGEIPDCFDGPADLRAFRGAAIARMDLPGLAREMLAHEDGLGFRAPRRAVPAAGTEGMIDVPLVPVR